MSAPSMAEVLAEHARGDWSDRTYSCQGCRQRFEDETRGEWESLTTRDEKAEYQARLFRFIKPDWTLDEYNAHVAQALAAAGFGHVGSVEAHAETCERVAMAQAERAEAAKAKVAAAKDEGAAEALDALRERLVAAERQLRELAPTFWESVERERVSGKAQGMQLALSYVDEMTRLREQVGE